MKISELDALLVLYLLVNGPSSSYQIAKDFLSVGILHEPRSGFPGVVRVVDSRLKRLLREGYLSKQDSLYVPTDMVYLDVLRVSGYQLDVDLGPCVVFRTNNGHYVLFQVDALLAPLEDDAVLQLFGNKQELVSRGI